MTIGEEAQSFVPMAGYRERVGASARGDNTGVIMPVYFLSGVDAL